MNAPSIQATKFRIQAILDVNVPQSLSERAQLWKMANSGEIVDSSTVLRAIARADVLESPMVIQDLYDLHGNIVSGPDGDDKVTNIIALLSIKQIADLLGY
jgi:hypothetical protein